MGVLLYLGLSPIGGNKTIPHNPHIRLPYRNRCFNIYFQIQSTIKQNFREKPVMELLLRNYPSISIDSSAFLGPLRVIFSPKVALNPSTAAKTGILVSSERYSASFSGLALSILIPK